MHTASKHIPSTTVHAQKPWISATTLQHISSRNTARLQHQHDLEKSLNKLIKQSAKADRRTWIEEQLQNGNWSAVKRYRKGFCPPPGRLQNSKGDLVDTSQRADTLATYFENVQWDGNWEPLQPGAISIQPLGNRLEINVNEFSKEELMASARKAKRNRASGVDNIPAEFWKILVDDPQAVEYLLEVCNLAWNSKELPSTWKHADVVTIFKKGSTQLPSNYRPISLLSVAYKLLASMMLERLRAGGCEKFLRRTQFGFRANHSTSQAIYIAKRLIDRTLDSKNGELSVLLLDWSKAFDKVRPEPMLVALRRFGIPEEFIQMIDSIYSDRTFSIRECGVTSTARPQCSGIAQGCPLSPYLFIIVLTVIFQDVDCSAENNPNSFLEEKTTSAKHLLDISYADDTLISGMCRERLQTYLHALIKTAGLYGLQPNWDKTLHLRLGHEDDVYTPDGSPIKTVSQAVYLGSLLTTTGSSSSSVSRRIGEAMRAFSSLCDVWKQAGISKARKIQIYESCIISKLSFAVECECLRKADKTRLDAFHGKCLRKILKVPPSWISRITNSTVLEMAKSKHLSERLLHNQLVLFGRIALRLNGDLMRQLTFKPNSLQPVLLHRKRGRPRLSWQSVLLAQATTCISPSQLDSLLLSEGSTLNSWKQHLAERGL